MKNFRVYCAIFIIFITIIYNNCNAFHIATIQSFSDIIAHNKIRLRISLDPQEEGIIHETLRFSVDSPIIEFKGLQTSIQPESFQHPAFKSSRQIYKESFFATLNISPTRAPEKSIPTTFCVAAFVLKKDGSIATHTATTTIKSSSITSQNIKEVHPKTISARAANKPIASSSPATPQPTNLWHELSLINDLTDIWNKSANLFNLILAWPYLWIIYLLVLICYIGLMVKHKAQLIRYLPKFSPQVNHELRRLCRWILAGFTLNYASSALPAALFYFSAGFFMLVACYSFSSQQHGEARTFLEKLQLLVGFICGLCVLPLIIKGIIALGLRF